MTVPVLPVVTPPPFLALHRTLVFVEPPPRENTLPSLLDDNSYINCNQIDKTKRKQHSKTEKVSPWWLCREDWMSDTCGVFARSNSLKSVFLSTESVVN